MMLEKHYLTRRVRTRANSRTSSLASSNVNPKEFFNRCSRFGLEPAFSFNQVQPNHQSTQEESQEEHLSPLATGQPA